MDDATCAVDTCQTASFARGWCKAHYARWRKYGDPTHAPQRAKSSSVCSVDGCEGPHPKIRLGLCGKHYRRHVQYGSAELPARVHRACEGPDCRRRAGKSGLCPSHYKQRHLGKELTPLKVWGKHLDRPKVCIFQGCGRPHKARGLCKSHNEQAQRNEQLHPVKPQNPGATCSQPSCDKVAVARGMCPADWWFFQKNLARYGLTADQYEAMHWAQGGVCAICGGVNANGNRLSIDHDHSCCAKGSCGECVRGLLCAGCNFAIGHANDDPQRLRAAATYVETRSRRELRLM